jgi:dienelactone hydrolase
MVVTMMRPPGEAPVPLVVINHGSPADAKERPRMSRPIFAPLSSWFLAHGYAVVLPLRQGYGATGGTWAEAYGTCANPDYFNAGLRGAADIRATIDFMRGQPFIMPQRTLVVGHSAGGWATLALSSRNVPGVAGLVNFAGGRGGHQTGASAINGNCGPQALVSAAGKYGATGRQSTLWIYSNNDTFFGPRLAHQMADAYAAGGGKVDFHAVASFGNDGHQLATSPEGIPIWSPLVEKFLRAQ